MRSGRILLGLALALAGTAGCKSDPLSCGSPPDLGGTWAYTGNQTMPTAALSGTLTLTRTGTCGISGSLLLTVNDGGTPTTSSWPTSGDFLNDSIVEFDATGAIDRYHLGTMHADTISGTWNATSGSASGSFRAVRTGP